ncbi:polysaccharide biosynthesis tyrosine autokinase [Sphingomonas sp. CBMAI 2297]|uniref:GumC family protein n=1 Tax=Sphingomonas sp. CBMAI 2297 TaxID=2991720 RepID=UPI0024560C0B|nr:polysaccharide biosynthesis tyrosine autokinase [Sphingomonas sp. CBMAI 2297]MDH4743000.1 polysaccharide biosynthesis tyrosine autokinase [Sphingomonas sp. CBMAI 2297]
MSQSFDLKQKSLVSESADTAPSVGVQARGERMPLLVSAWFTALRRKWIILPIVMGSLVLGLIVTMLATPKFTATTRVEISKAKANVTKVGELDEDSKITDITFYQTQYALLRARSLAERVTRSLKLVDDPRFYEGFGLARGGAAVSDGPMQRLTPVQREQEFEKIVGTLLAGVSILPVRDSSLVDVRFTAPDPAYSAQISNEWVKQFIQSNIEQRFAATSDARAFLETRLEQLRRRLEQSERDLVNYSAEQEIVPLSTTVGADGKTRSDRTLVGDKLEALNTALSAATADRILAQSRLGRGGDITTPSSQQNTALVALRSRRAEVAAERSKLLAQFEPGYPQVQALTSQLASLDREIEAERGRTSTGVNREYDEAVSRETRLRALVDQLKSQLNDQQRRGIQFNIYQREVDTNRELYNALLQRYKEIGVAGVGSNNVFVVDPAKLPRSPSSPNLLLNLLLAGFLGIIVAGAVTFGLEQIDERITDPGDVANLIDVPLLGAIPVARDVQPLQDLDDVKSITSDAYLTAVTGLRFSTDHGIPRSIMVTSTRAAEGKSTSASAIARIIARTGRTVVLIDGDMRSPSLHYAFGLQNERGLSNYLAGESDVKPLLLKSDRDDVTLLPSGPQPPNAAELLSGGRMRLLIDTLLTEYDQVVVDMPPVLGLADVPLMAQTVEGVVYVVAAREASRRVIKTALGRLLAARARILGVVFTKLEAQTRNYGYGYEYSYGNKK